MVSATVAVLVCVCLSLLAACRVPAAAAEAPSRDADVCPSSCHSGLGSPLSPGIIPVKTTLSWDSGKEESRAEMSEATRQSLHAARYRNCLLVEIGASTQAWEPSLTFTERKDSQTLLWHCLHVCKLKQTLTPSLKGFEFCGWKVKYSK